MHKGFGALWLLISWASLGCSSGDVASSAPLEIAGSGGLGTKSSSAGTTGAEGRAGGSPTLGMTAGAGAGAGASAGSASSGGRSTGSGAGGVAGANNAGANNAGMNSAGALGGNFAIAGSGGKTGSGGGGSVPAPTFTMIYDTLITKSCGGTQCHLKRPTPQDYDFSSKSAASNAWRSDVIAGDGLDSPLFQVLNFGIMPKGEPSLSVEQLTMVLDWIDAGALDN